MEGASERPAAPSPGRRAVRWFAVAAGLVVLATAGGTVWLLAPAWRLAGGVAAATHEAPSRLYARPLVLRTGEPLAARRVLEELEALGYREDHGPPKPAPGGFRRVPGGWIVHLRRFPTARGTDTGGVLAVHVAGGAVAALERDGARVDEAALEPVLLATFLGDDRTDRRPLPPGPLPELVVHAVLASEDAGFFSHPGISPSGIARALWVDVRRGEPSQGGSTITQQLVKNLVLSGERTLARKAREAALALLLEMRSSKTEILRAYLDSVYMGAYDGVSLVGVGAASRAFFGKDPDQLSLAEAATLAGMLPAPARTSPVAEPERARARRDLVLRRMAALGWADGDEVARAIAAPVATAPAPPAPERAPYVLAPVREEAGRRIGGTPLERAGLALLSTLDWRDERAAERAVTGGLGVQGRRRLEAALVSLDPRDGGVRAYVGGRSWAESQFDRAGRARRQAGSAFKPVVYATAFAAGLASPAAILDDEPLSIAAAGGAWTPRDDDGTFLGPIPARLALEQSRNVPAARLALAVGLGPVIATARAMGIVSPLEAVPSLALGACGVSPLELATAYATLAAGGVRPSVHFLMAALGPSGAPVELSPLPRPQRALPAPVAYLVTDVLRGVLDHGTGASARALGVEDALAGKTGTSNGGRDAWFVGYSPDRATAVWVGRDDDRPTGLTGARAALPIWARFSLAVRPPEGYPPFVEPAGIVHARVDPATGELATTRCPEVRDELFLAGRAPTAACSVHSGLLAVVVAQPEGVAVEKAGFFRRLLAKVFARRPKTP